MTVELVHVEPPRVPQKVCNNHDPVWALLGMACPRCHRQSLSALCRQHCIGTSTAVAHWLDAQLGADMRQALLKPLPPEGFFVRGIAMPIFDFEVIDGHLIPTGPLEFADLEAAENEARHALFEMHGQKYGDTSVIVKDESGTVLLTVQLCATVERHVRKAALDPVGR